MLKADAFSVTELVEKPCYNCHRVLPIGAFSRHVVNGIEYRNRRCGHCRALRAAGSDVAREKRKVVEDAKSKPCADCAVTFPLVCMEFDHLPGTKKAFNVSSSWRSVSIERIQAELMKCEVVCSNYHRIRTNHKRPMTGGRPAVFLATLPPAAASAAPQPGAVAVT